MRTAQKSNRSRGRGNRKGGGGGGNNINRVYDSAGPEGKVRGTPQQIIEKYVSLARDAQTSGDRVTAENFLQHAEHYQRILIEATAAQERSRREQPEAGGQQQPTEVVDPGSAEQPDVAMPAESQAASESGGSSPAIEGMTMIDAGTPDNGLLVESEDITKSQPRKNGEGRNRRKPRRENGASKEATRTGDAAASDSADAPVSDAPAAVVAAATSQPEAKPATAAKPDAQAPEAAASDEG